MLACVLGALCSSRAGWLPQTPTAWESQRQEPDFLSPCCSTLYHLIFPGAVLRPTPQGEAWVAEAGCGEGVV